MRFLSETSSDGVREQLLIPGVLWTPQDAAGPRPLILLGHGGGQHKKTPGVVARARRFAADCGFAAAAVDAPNHGDRPKDEKYDRIVTASAEKTLHANPGKHADVPRFEVDSTVSFFARHLG